MKKLAIILILICSMVFSLYSNSHCDDRNINDTTTKKTFWNKNKYWVIGCAIILGFAGYYFVKNNNSNLDILPFKLNFGMSPNDIGKILKDLDKSTDEDKNIKLNIGDALMLQPYLSQRLYKFILVEDKAHHIYKMYDIGFFNRENIDLSHMSVWQFRRSISRDYIFYFYNEKLISLFSIYAAGNENSFIESIANIKKKVNLFTLYENKSDDFFNNNLKSNKSLYTGIGKNTIISIFYGKSKRVGQSQETEQVISYYYFNHLSNSDIQTPNYHNNITNYFKNQISNQLHSGIKKNLNNDF